MIHVKFKLSEDSKSLTIEHEDGNHITLPSKTVEECIPILMHLRSQMEPRLPFRDLQAGDRLLSADGMRWWSGLFDGRHVLALYHPGLGWLGCSMPPEGVQALKDLLEKQLPLLKAYKPPTLQ